MNRIIVFFLLLIFSTTAFAQQYKTHAVKKGETIESIARQYKVTPYNILKLNPEVKDGVKENVILIIPGNTPTEVKTVETKVDSSKTNNESDQEVTLSIHKVRGKETIYGIAKMYGISQEDLKRFNKELYSRELKKGEKINIPRKTPKTLTISDEIAQIKEEEKTVSLQNLVVNNVIDSTKFEKKLEFSSFLKHKVRKKETLFGIAKKYNITEDDIKRYNKDLYSRQLKKGEKIQIPVFKEVLVEIIEKDPLKGEKEIHVVKPQETRWGIANSYGLTISQLKKLNPAMGEIIKIGDSITIPKNDELVNIANSDAFVFYEVKPKETLYSLTREFKISADSLQIHNPLLKDGLKAGMILKIPKKDAIGFNVENSVIIKKFSLLDSINVNNKSKLAILIPFRLETIDFESKKDIAVNVKRSGNLNMALDFYTGSLMAMDAIEELGLSADVKIFDSEASEAIVTDIVASTNFNEFDAVIGPFMPSVFNRLSEELRKDSIPVFSPLSSNVKLEANVFQTIPSEDMIRNKMITFIKENIADRQLIIVSDEEHDSVKKNLVAQFPQIQVLKPIENTFIRLDDINPLLSSDKENWVIVETENIALLTNISSVLNSAMIEEIKITMLTTKRNNAYESENVSNFHLSNLNFHFPAIDKTSSLNSDFNKKYKTKYKTIPSRYATRGYDVTMDVLLRLAYSKNVSATARYIGETKYVENKFEYNSNYLGGHYNKGVYILKYEDLEIIEVESSQKLLAEK